MIDQTALTTALADRYRIGRQLGAGGMASVFLARDLKHDRDVAIKVLKPELAQSLTGERILREIGITARLNHPHILPLLDSGTAENGAFLYYVMPVATGESVRDHLARHGAMSVAESVRCGLEVTEALVAAHAMGVVHRDIKPDNVLLSSVRSSSTSASRRRWVTRARRTRSPWMACPIVAAAVLQPARHYGSRQEAHRVRGRAFPAAAGHGVGVAEMA